MLLKFWDVLHRLCGESWTDVQLSDGIEMRLVFDKSGSAKTSSTDVSLRSTTSPAAARLVQPTKVSMGPPAFEDTLRGLVGREVGIEITRRRLLGGGVAGGLVLAL